MKRLRFAAVLTVILAFLLSISAYGMSESMPLVIDEADLIYTHDGGVVYKGELVRAVKHFQEFHGFYVDGIIGSALIKALRKKIER